MIGVDFEVLEPPELVEEIRRLADRFGRAVRPLDGLRLPVCYVAGAGSSLSPRTNTA